jgi:hypothetical protein
MKKETAQKAAKWWADLIDNPSPPDNGDTSENGALVLMMGMLLQSEKAKKLPEGASSKFAKHL